MTIFSTLALFAGCMGICAVYQYSRPLMSAFWIAMIFCLIGFAAAGAVAIAVPLFFYNGGCLGSTYASTLYINNQTAQAAQRLCRLSPINCLCYLNPNGSSYSQLNTMILANSLNTTTINYSAPVSVFQCPNWVLGTYDRTLSAF